MNLRKTTKIELARLFHIKSDAADRAASEAAFWKKQYEDIFDVWVSEPDYVHAGIVGAAIGAALVGVVWGCVVYFT